MSAPKVYHQVYQLIREQIDPQVDDSSVTRLALLVTGLLKGRSASPAQVARSLASLHLTAATAESIERRLRRLENDPEINASLCFHPFARFHLRLGQPQALRLILDPTMQADHLVMVSVAVWYRGRALPLAWVVWPGNTPLEGEGFWQRIERLLAEVAPLLPSGVPVTLLADRAFGTPALIDRLAAYGWHYVLRVQGQTRCRDRLGRERTVASLVPFRQRRAKLQGDAFKKAGWRPVSLVAYWGKRHQTPLCLVSDLKPDWSLLHLYRQRYPIEASFRDYKTSGWRWEQGQVKHLAHVERLLVGMALATWLALLAGTQVAQQCLHQPPTGRRRTRPWAAKLSLFQHGLDLFQRALHDPTVLPSVWRLADWAALNWSQQLDFHVRRAYVFA